MGLQAGVIRLSSARLGPHNAAWEDHDVKAQRLKIAGSLHRRRPAFDHIGQQRHPPFELLRDAAQFRA